MKRILIVEDNEKHMEALYKLLSNIEGIEIVRAYNMTEACYMLSLYEFSLFIVDIILDTEKLNDVSGIDLVKHIRDISKYQFTPIIFTTSLEDPQLSAYRDLHCYQYIEKPFDKDYVLKVIKQALKYEITKSEKEYVYYRKSGIIYPVKVEDIIYIEVTRGGTKIHTKKDCLKLGYKSVSELLNDISSSEFVQCNRSTIVNKEYIQHIDLVNRYIKLKDIEVDLDIGPIMKKQIKDMLREEV